MSGPQMLTVLRVGPLELAVLTALWDTERPLTVREVHDQLSYPGWPAYSQVAEVLSGLFFKGRVRRTRDHGRRWFYSAAQSRDEYLAEGIRAFLAVAGEPAAALALAARPP
ncbi:MAG TPA: BlaI/MecI/CopY family transcriptional regulator, partial [Streptosporangiaceae bacterium]